MSQPNPPYDPQQPYGQVPETPQAPSYGQQPYGQPPQQPYGQQPYGQPGYGYPQPSPTNTLAVVSLIASILGVLPILPVIGSIVGVITGHMAKKQIAETGEGGGGMATTGLVVGYIGLALVVLGVIGWIVLFAAAGTADYYSS